MKKITFTALLCLCLGAMSFAQTRDSRQLADHYLRTRNAVVFTVKARSLAEAEKVSRIVSVDHGHEELDNLSFKASAGSEDFHRFLKLGVPFEVASTDNEIPQSYTQRPPAGTGSTMAAWDTTWDAYPTYTEYVNKLNAWVAAYPGICSLQNIGATNNGRNLYVLKISDNVATDEGEPEFFYSSSMHGDEITGYPTMMHFIDNLLSNYNSGNAEAVSIVQNVELFICPLANPDGSYKTAGNVVYNSTGNTPTRENANGYDLNRNYPNWIQQGTTNLLHPDAHPYQVETQAFMNWQRGRHIVMGANYHGGDQVMNYPWDGSATAGTSPNINRYSMHPHDTWWKLVALGYAQTCQAVNSSYMASVFAGQQAGITNGAAWYVILGGRQDYANYFEHNKELTIECSSTKSPAASALPNYWNWNKQAIIDYIKRVTYGLHGYVRDAAGNPIHAKVYVSGQDTRGSWVQSSATVGDYHKLQIAGTYNVTFEAAGYASQTHTVTITNTAATNLNVTMVPLAPTASGVTICQGQTASLTATAPGTGNYKWYTTPTGTTPVSSTAGYTTGALNADTTYYAAYEPTLGALTTAAATGTATATATMKGKYLTFNCTAPTQLKSVSVVAGAAGDIMVELQDSTGAMIQAKVITITGSGTQVLPLDFYVPVGDNLRLVCRETTFTMRINTTMATTGISNSFITLVGSSTTSFFHFFSNWQFEPLVTGTRTPVTVTVKPNQTSTAVSPTSKAVSSGAFTLTVNGTNFRDGEHTIQWNGNARTTTWVSATQLTASIPASDITTAGNASVTVLNTCNNFTTTALTFTICGSPVANVTNLPAVNAQCTTSLTAPTATSNCYGTITGTTSNMAFNVDGTYTVTWTYNDGNGGITTQNQTVNINDTTAPVPNVANLPTATGQCAATVTAPTATDACRGTITATTANPTTYNVEGTYTVTWTYNDGNGNTSSQTQTVVIDDTIAPVPNVANLPALSDSCSVTLVAPTATDACGGTITATTGNPTTYTAEGTYTVTWNYNDGRGNTSSQTQSVTINDVTAPVPNVASLPSRTDSCAVTLVAPTATDACAGQITATTANPTTYTAEGTYTVTWNYNDGRGNTSSQTQSVTISDVTAPVPNIANLPTVTGQCSATVTTPPTATDACAGQITGTTVNPLTYNTDGTYTITWSYNDGRGNTSTQTQTVIVDDTVAPVPNVTNLPALSDSCSVTLVPPTAADACAGTITATTANPTTYTAEGTYTVTWNYNDGRGNTSSQTQSVTINDTTAPVPNVASLATVTGQCTASVNAPTATDACAGQITATTVNPTTYNAEGTYTVTWTYNDGRGNTSTQTQTVVIDDTTAPVPTVDSLPALSGTCSVTLTAPTATDNCGGTITATTTSPMTITTPGATLVTWTYNDGRGNSTTRTQSVTVNTPTVNMTPGNGACPGAIRAITAIGNGNSYNWTSVPSGVLYTNAAATIAYTNQNITTVYLKTTQTANVTVTATGGAGCTNSATQTYLTNTTTWNGSAWSNGAPNAATAASFTGSFTSAGDLTACSLNVSNNASVTVSSGNDFNIGGPVTVEAGSVLKFENNSNLLQNPDNTTNVNSGNIMVKRIAKMWRQDYVYWGAPVAGQNLRNFSPATLEARFYALDEPTNTFKGTFGTASTTNYGYNPATYEFVPAKGYMIRAPNDFINPLYAQPQLQPSFTGVFTGVPNDGTVTIPVTKTTGSAGFNLLANPYPSTINAYDFLTANPGTLYFWTHNDQTSLAGANYATFTSLGGTPAPTGGVAPNGTIQVGQGFMYVTASSGTATFTNAMRTGNNDNQFFRSGAPGNTTSTEPGSTPFELHRIWLNMRTTENVFLNQILIGYMTGASTTGLDYGIDGTQMDTGGSRMYSLIDDDTEYAIQGRAIPFVENDIVPIGVKAMTAGTYKVEIDHVDGLFLGDQDIFLHDKTANVYHDLKAGAYTFASVDGTINDRFEVVYENTTLGVGQAGIDDNSLAIYKSEGVLTVFSSVKNISDISIFDVRGRLIYSKSGVGETTARLSDLKAEQQVLLVNVTTEDGVKTVRKVMY